MNLYWRTNSRKKDVIKIPYVDDLELYFVIDKENVFKELNKKEFCKLNISIEELKSQSVGKC